MSVISGNPPTADAGIDPVVRFSAITTEPLDVAEHEAWTADRASGAIVSFAGVVRDHDQGRSVSHLEYLSHPSAEAVLAEVAAEVAGSEPEVRAVAVSHRIGALKVGDVALVAVVSCAHRAEAFRACAKLVDMVKSRVPIWKRQEFVDGEEEWVACP
jgi:molybdopterin synthase catalytic subunit